MLFWPQFYSSLIWQHWLLRYWPGFLQWWEVGLGFSGFWCVTCCVTVFICSSSGAFKPFSSKSLSRYDTIKLHVQFSKGAWFIDFFRWGGILAYLNCSMIAWATASSASFASFWSSSRKSIDLWFAGLKTIRWSLCFAAAIYWGFTYFLRNTVNFFPGCLCWGYWCLWMFVVHVWGSGSSVFCILL